MPDTTDSQIIDAVSAAQLGDTSPAPAPAAPDPVPTPTEDAKTATEAAVEAVSPTTEGDKQSEDPVVFNVAFGENDKRQLSEAQIKGTFQRYADLNNKHATMKPIFDFANEILDGAKAAGNDTSPEQVRDFLQAAAQAFIKNPTMGDNKNPQPSDGTQRQDVPIDTGKLDEDLANWEAENGVSLPPQYKESATKMSSLEAQNAQIMQMLDQVIQGQQGVTEAAATQVAAANQQQAQNMQQVAANNLDQVQAQLQLPDNASDAFFQFAFERGYTFEDFVNADLTMAVMSDFKNKVDAPEMQRLTEIAKRRQAFTGTGDGSPSAGAAPAPSEEEQEFNNLVDSAMAQRFPQ